MTKEGQHFTVWKGNDYTPYVVVDLAGHSDLTLYQSDIFWAVSKKNKDEEPIIYKDKTDGGGIHILDKNLFSISLNKEDTQDMAPGIYYHEARLVDMYGNVSILMTGHMRLKGALLKIGENK